MSVGQIDPGVRQASGVYKLRLRYGGVVGGLGQNQDLGFSGYIDPTILSVHPTFAYLTLTPNRYIPSGIIGTTPIAHYFFV